MLVVCYLVHMPAHRLATTKENTIMKFQTTYRFNRDIKLDISKDDRTGLWLVFAARKKDVIGHCVLTFDAASKLLTEVDSLQHIKGHKISRACCAVAQAMGEAAADDREARIAARETAPSQELWDHALQLHRDLTNSCDLAYVTAVANNCLTSMRMVLRAHMSGTGLDTTEHACIQLAAAESLTA